MFSLLDIGLLKTGSFVYIYKCGSEYAGYPESQIHSAEICAVAAQPCTFHRVSGSKVEETFGGGSADGGLLQGSP